MADTSRVQHRRSRVSGNPIRSLGRRASRLAAPTVAAVLAAAAGAVLLAAPRAALAQDAPDEVRQRMDDRAYFVGALDRGWEPLIKDLDAHIAELAAGERRPVLEIRDRAKHDYAGRIETKVDLPKGGEARALELWIELSTEAVDASRHPEFALKAAKIEVRQARRIEATDEPRALELAQSAAKRSPGYEEAYDVISRLALKMSDRFEGKDQFIEALDSLKTSITLLPETTPARGQLISRQEQILRTTGEVAVDWLGTPETMARVKGPKADFMAGTLELRSVDGKRAPPAQKPNGPMRVRTGTYEVVQRGSEGPVTHSAGQVKVEPTGAAVTLLSALPEGMVFVPAIGARQDAFLIDRTEVTVSEFQRPGSGAGGDRTAKGGVSLGAAKDYAARAGKQLPSKEQWLTAAFGDPEGKSRQYPWGDAAPEVGRHFAGALDAPTTVGSCPEGASRYGCLDMAGNVWEWLSDDWYIGGGYGRSVLTRNIPPKEGSDDPPWPADALRDPAPSDELYADESRWVTPQQRARYFNYRPRGDVANLAQIGLRCVIDLGKPWRQRT